MPQLSREEAAKHHKKTVRTISDEVNHQSGAHVNKNKITTHDPDLSDSSEDSDQEGAGDDDGEALLQVHNLSAKQPHAVPPPVNKRYPAPRHETTKEVIFHLLPQQQPVGWFHITSAEWKTFLDEDSDIMQDKMFPAWTMQQIVAYSRNRKQRSRKTETSNVSFDDLCRNGINVNVPRDYTAHSETPGDSNTVHQRCMHSAPFNTCEVFVRRAKENITITPHNSFTFYELGNFDIPVPTWSKLFNLANQDLKLEDLLKDTFTRNDVFEINTSGKVNATTKKKEILTMAQLQRAVMKLTITRLRIFILDTSMLTLTYFLVDQNWLEHYTGRNIYLLVRYVNGVINDNGRRYAQARPHLTYDELRNKLPDYFPNSFQNRQNVTAASSSSDNSRKRKRTADGKKTPEQVSKFVAKICTKFNMPGVSCSNKKNERGHCLDSNNKKWLHLCNKMLSDGTACGKAHAASQHT